MAVSTQAAEIFPTIVITIKVNMVDVFTPRYFALPTERLLSDDQFPNLKERSRVSASRPWLAWHAQ